MLCFKNLRKFLLSDFIDASMELIIYRNYRGKEFMMEAVDVLKGVCGIRVCLADT